MLPFRNNISKKQLALLIGDIAILVTAPFMAAYIHCSIDLGTVIKIVYLKFEKLPFILNILLFLTVFYVMDLYGLKKNYLSKREILNILIAIITSSILSIFFFYLIGKPPLGRWIFLIYISSIFLLVFGVRAFYSKFAIKNEIENKCVIIGTGQAGHDLHAMLSDRNDYEIVGFLDDDHEKRGTYLGKTKVLGGTELLLSLLDRINVVIVTLSQNIPAELHRGLVEAKLRGVMVYQMPAFCEMVLSKIPVRHVSDQWFVYVPISGVQKNLYNIKIKRLIDIVLSLAGLLITLPLTIPVALAIRLESNGPVFYIQKRIGFYKQPFNLVKFRTMRTGLENNRKYAGQHDDPRITRVGRIIRLFRIDEIPQMLNVIIGDMSFIGPRALIEEEVNEFSREIPFFSMRHFIRPGITGWAQINYPHGTTIQDGLAKLEYDLYYIKNLSPIIDLIILVRTIKTVVLRHGAR
jgi:exopolysaccharide biosynthesis polyprenyl glycosylphosphotransferase